MCSEEQVSALIAFGVEHDTGIQWGGSYIPLAVDPAAFANELYLENARGFNKCYAHRPEYWVLSADCAEMRYIPTKREFTPVQMIKLCDFYDYQAGDTPDYEQSKAFLIVSKIRAHAGTLLPGWKEAAWGL
jgi:hypothetical protein